MNETEINLIDQPGGRVLVVDDEEKNRLLLADVLRAQGYTIRTANDGMEAMQAAAEFQPETVLLDIVMPKLDGVEVCRRLKADPATASIPILLTTALHEHADRMRGLQAGANDFLTKPLDTREVSSRVKNAIHSKRLHDRLRDAYGQLQKLEELRDSLTHMIVHDLRTPLMTVSISMELIMREEERLSALQKDGARIAKESCRELIEMVSSMLDVSRMEEGKMPLRLVLSDLMEIAREAVTSLSVSGRHEDMTLCAAGDVPQCNVDRDIIRRVFVNLLVNAIKFSPPRTPITIEVALVGDAVRCEVKDSGYGIPPKYLQRVFDKFCQVRARKEGKSYSSGLGLTFCKLAVEAHGGKIGVESPSTPLRAGKVGKGSTFWFTLPNTHN